MATIFGSALSPMEKEAELMFMESTITMSKISTMENIVNSQFERAILECDYYAMKEGSSYDEYDRMIMEATVDKDGKEMGIIRSIINAIGSAINKIGEWIQKAVGADLEKMKNVPDDATVTMTAEESKKMSDAVKFIPKALNSIKETMNKIENAVKNHTTLSIKGVTVASFATAMGLGVFIDGSKESESAKKSSETTETKGGIEGYVRKWLGIQKEATDIQNQANKLLTLLEKGPNLVKDAAQKNIDDAKQKEAEKAQNAKPTGESVEESGASTVTESTYGLSAYDGLFMEASSGTQQAYARQISAVKKAIAKQDKAAAIRALNSARGYANGATGADGDTWSNEVSSLEKQVQSLPDQQPAAQKPAQQKTQPANKKPQKQNAATSAKTSQGSGSSILDANVTNDDYTNGGSAQVSNPGQAQTAYNSTTHKPDPARGTATVGNKKKSNADPNLSEGNGATRDESIPAKGQDVVQAGTEKVKSLGRKARNTVKPILDKARNLLNQKKPKEAENAIKELRGFTLDATSKAEYEEIMKDISIQIGNASDEPKTDYKDGGVAKNRRTKVAKNAAANSQEVDTSVVNAEMNTDNTDNVQLPWYKEAIAWLKAVLQVLALVIPAGGKCLVDGIAGLFNKARKLVGGGDDLGDDVEDETPKDNANADQNAQPEQQPTQPTKESVEDLFGIGDEYREMMEGPEPESLQQFDQIIQDL